MALSFELDIKKLFREKDIKAMIKKGHFDLSLYVDVKAHAQNILIRLQRGDMPCDGAWPPDNVDKFSQWIDDGMQP